MIIHAPRRRQFLHGLACTGAWLGALRGLPSVSAREAMVSPATVRFLPEAEPLVRLIEETPRGELLEVIGRGIRSGKYSYRAVLTSLLLAGIRNIQPRPVGFKFHAVLVVHSAHMAGLNSPDSDRWLPVLWALDQFKSSQARDVAEGDWTMAPVDEAAVPDAARARKAFREAMDAWDPVRADAATAGLVRTAGAQEVFDLFCLYGARDFRDIGHKIIYTANSWRTLQTIGWHHAEPVLRSLAYALLEHEPGNPADRDAPQDRPGRRNLQLVDGIRPDWQRGVISGPARVEMLEALRGGDWRQGPDKALELLSRGTDPRCVWDACFQSASEMLMRRPGILSLHAGTTLNALHYAWQNCADDRTRRFLLLQATSFMPMFREVAGAGGEGLRVDTFEAAPPAGGSDPGAGLEEIFSGLSQDPLQAARLSLGWLGAGGQAAGFIAAAQRLICLKGTDSHDYKYSSAVFEDYHFLPPGIRDRFLAASVFQLQGTAAPDNPVIIRAREALRG